MKLTDILTKQTYNNNNKQSENENLRNLKCGQQTPTGGLQ